MTGWRSALRLARRDALRSRANSLLVLLLIALPVLAVVAAAVVWETRDVDSDEALERRLGSAAAYVDRLEGAVDVKQAFDPEDGTTWGSENADGSTPASATLDRVLEALGGERPTATLTRGDVEARTDHGGTRLDVVELDLADPLADGLFSLVHGRVPSAPVEVVVSPAMAERGPGIGATLATTTTGGAERELTVVGIADSTSERSRLLAVAPPGAFGFTEHETYTRGWLVGGDPVGWSDVQAVNAVGATVVSRAVLTDPPPESALDPEIRSWATQGLDDVDIAVIALIVVMVLIEVVLLAGPAFAVGARRHARTLALLAASGGTPRQARRVVLSSAVVLGGLGTAFGAVAGIGVGVLALPVVQRFDTQWFGPLDVPLLAAAGVAAFGLVSALLAAAVPAWIASRQDPVAVLAGRRGDPKPLRRFPVLGLLLFGLGVAGSALGSRPGGELLIAGSAILCVLGMVLLVPLVVTGVARLAGRLPLSLRFATRDAARHRTRTAPAVAAVAATVAGVVTLGIALSSDRAEEESHYAPLLTAGTSRVASATAGADWEEYEATIRSVLGDREITPVRGVPEQDQFVVTSVALPGAPDGQPVLDGSQGGLGSRVLVAGTVPPALPLGNADRARADAALAGGGVVAFSDEAHQDARTEVRVETMPMTPAPGAEEGHAGEARPAGKAPQEQTYRATLPIAFVETPAWSAPAELVLSPEAAAALKVPAETVALVPDGELTAEEQADLEEALFDLPGDANLYTENGFAQDDRIVIIQLVLGALGAVLMLGGTLTATFLALSDARPDLATLAAVGARPRTRRSIAAAYALVIGLLGSVLGVLVGFVPGVAISRPLTSSASWAPGAPAEYVLAIPWGLIGIVVVGLPLLTATLVGLTARSRLPMVARID